MSQAPRARGCDSAHIAAQLHTPLPRALPIGRGNALFVEGSSSGRPAEIAVGERALEPLGLIGDRGAVRWWAVAPFDSGSAPGGVELSLTEDGERTSLGQFELAAGAGPTGAGSRRGTVAICLATHDPDPVMLARQLGSIRSQTFEDWTCLISDDASSPAGREAIEAAIGGDPRFTVVNHSARLGVYANFERALGMVPAEAGFVSLCDQDDRWHPERLEALIGEIEAGASLAYSDLRLTAPDGTQLTPTYWTRRANNFTDLGSLLLANTITGAAMVFDRALLDSILPFPPAHGRAMHDHWIAQVALSAGRIAYVDRALVDYVQHDGAALGHAAANASGRFGGSRSERIQSWAQLLGDRDRRSPRAAYFDLYCRLVQCAEVLRLRFGETLDPERTALLACIGDHRCTARWLVRRTLRPSTDASATLGREQAILAGLGWYAARKATSRGWRG